VDAPDSDEGWAARECARWLLGRLRGGVEGEAQVREAESRMTSRGMVPDRRLVLLLFPGLRGRV
jgi:hypothetical protein